MRLSPGQSLGVSGISSSGATVSYNFTEISLVTNSPIRIGSDTLSNVIGNKVVITAGINPIEVTSFNVSSNSQESIAIQLISGASSEDIASGVIDKLNDCSLENNIWLFSPLQPNDASQAVEVVRLSVVSSATDATNNVSAINTAIQNFNNIIIVGQGVAEINGRVVQRSNTVVSMQKGLKLKQRDNTNSNNLWVTDAYDTMSSHATVTPSWTSGHLFNLQWTAHEVVTNDSVWIRADTLTATSTTPEYLGVFSVESVTDADNIVLRTIKPPIAAPQITGGVFKAVKATTNFVMEDITIDYNTANNTAPSLDTGRHCVVIGGASRFELNRLNIQNANKYCLCIGGVTAFKVKDFTYDSNSDGIKVYGPCWGDWVVDGIRGQGKDDIISVHTGEDQILFSQYRFVFGNVFDGVVKNVFAKTTVGAIATYTSDNEFMDSITFKDCSVDTNSYCFKAFTAYTTGKGGTITLDNVTGINRAGTACISFQKPQWQTINIINCRPLMLHTRFIEFVLNGSAKNINIDKITADVAFPTTGLQVPVMVDQYTIDILTVTKSKFKKNGTQTMRVVNLNPLSAVKKLIVEGNQINTVDVVTVGSGLASVPKLNANGNVFESATQVFSLASAADCYANNNTMTGVTGGVLRANGTFAASLTTDGQNTLVSGNWFVIPSGTPTLTFKGEDIAIDVGATGVSRTAGAKLKNTAAGRGTLVQNELVVCDTTAAANSWHQVTVPTNVF
jgi:hypothetical protein